MSDDCTTDRRSFLGTAVAAISANWGSLAVGATAPSPSNSRLTVAFVGVGSRGSSLLQTVLKLRSEGLPIDIAGVADVYSVNRAGATAAVRTVSENVKSVVDYQELLSDDAVDAVFIATPDHWHARMAYDALQAGKHVYCEKPMTRTVFEATELLRVWRSSGRVMQVGVQCSALPVWKVANQWIREGRLGKVIQCQTEFYRNSVTGQWRNYSMRKEMTPQNIDWDRFLGVEQGLSKKVPFDRELFAQWRRYWAFGSGLFTDLFVHRITAMLLATGLRFPSRVVGAGGIFLELDGRQVPDVGTVVADYAEGVQSLVTATMCSEETPLRQLIRGHHGSIVFGNGEDFTGFDFVPERPQVTLNSSLRNERVETGGVPDPTYDHVSNFLTAALANDPSQVNCSPEVGAAALICARLAVQSYRQGKVFHFDPETLVVSDGNSSWADHWEAQSHAREKPNHVPGWEGGERGSSLHPPPDVSLAGPWINGADPAQNSP